MKRPSYDELAARVCELEDRCYDMSSKGIIRLLERCAVPTLAFDGNGGLVSCNDAMRGLTGYGTEDAEDLEAWCGLIMPGRPDDAAFFSSVPREGDVARGELTILHRDGDERTVLFTAHRFGAGSYHGLLVVHGFDITPRIKALAEVEKGRERLAMALEAAGEALWDYDYGGRMVHINETWAELLGYSPEEAVDVAQNWREIVHPEDRADIARRVDELTRGVVDYYDVQFRMRRKDGEWRWMHSRGRIIDRDGTGAPRRGAGTIIDVHERKTAELSLRESEAKLRTIIEYSRDGIVLLDEEGTVVEWNGGMENITGIARDDALGRPGWELMYLVKAVKKADRSDYDDFVRMFREVIRGGGTDMTGKIHEYRLQPVGGDAVDIQEILTVIGTDRGRMHLAILRDVTEARLMEEERNKTSKLESLSLLSAGIAHDFNNILTSVIGNVSLAMTYTDSGSELFDVLMEAKRSGLQARDLTGRLLTFSRGGDPVKKVLNPEEFILPVVELMRKDSMAVMETAVREDLWPVEADSAQMSQVMQNLLINARLAVPRDGRISVEAENVTIGSRSPLPLATGQYVRIAVSDTGPGIPQEDIGKVFDPYFTTRENASGLGLTTAYSIVKHHEGHIAVESGGDGTMVTFYLPATKRRPDRKPDGDVRETSPPARILVMDDDAMVRTVATRMLERLGHSVTTTPDGAAMLDEYRAGLDGGRPYDLVIMDLIVPDGMGGREGVARLKEMDPDARAVVSSGYSNDPVLARYTDYGFDGIIAKPYQMNELKEEIGRLLGQGAGGS